LKAFKYSERIKNLSTDQRRRLATKLGLGTGWETTPSDGGQRIMAYVVARSGVSVGPEDLREFLQKKLPEYMTPSAFVFLEALPLLPNGKVDRGALASRAETPAQAQATTGFVGPRNEVERKLAGIWAIVLGTDRVGVHDNFFQLGGHSLLALQVMARLRQTFQTEVPLRRLFETPTVAGLAEAVEQSQQGVFAAPIRRVSRTGSEPTLLNLSEPSLPAPFRSQGPFPVAEQSRD
jgi:acyl carrier protein